MPYARRRSTSRSRKSAPRRVSFARRRSTSRTRRRPSTAGSRRRTSRVRTGTARIGIRTANHQHSDLPFAERGFYNLPYAQVYASTANGSTDSAVVTNTFILNGCWSPLYGGGGGQPNQWEWISPFYERYQVYAAKFMITFTNTTDDRLWVGYRVRNSTDTTLTPGLTQEELMSMRDTKLLPMSNTGEQKKVFYGYVKINEGLGVSKTQFGSTQYSAKTANENPQVLLLLDPIVMTEATTDTSNTSCMVSIKIRYYFKMYGEISSIQPTTGPTPPPP